MQTMEGWFDAPGSEADVAVSSRVRLARNLLGIPFPPALSKEQEEQVQLEVAKAFDSASGEFEKIYLDRLAPLERKILLERNIISQDFCISPNKLVVLAKDGERSAMVNEEDHLRLACIHTGLCLEEVFSELDELDNQLEDTLHYAASIEWGYLASTLENVGTGLRASVMLHLPALVMDGTIGWVLKRINQMGLQIMGYWGEGDNSLGDMYQISNPLSIGYKEKEILRSVGKAAVEMLGYERKAREESLSSRRMELEDQIFRAYGVLGSCRLISSKEAIDLLSALRLGISLGVLSGPPIEAVTSLMIRVQKAHIQKMLDRMDDETDNKLVDYTRARLIRRTLEGYGQPGNGHPGCGRQSSGETNQGENAQEDNDV